MLRGSRERGDTLVEVLLAVVILSTVTVGAFTIMNRGVALSYGVLERTETRARVAQQLEILTYIRDIHAAEASAGRPLTGYPYALWTDIRTNRAMRPSGTPTAVNGCTPSPNSFYVDQYTDASNVTRYRLVNYTNQPPETTPRPGRGLWVEAVLSPDPIAVKYIDFYAKACWSSVSGGPRETISSAMRLYDR